MKTRTKILTWLGVLALAACDSSSNWREPAATSDQSPPNILFIVVDDAGVDQFETFGYGGAVPANTSSINAIAEAGVRFRNTWSMPTCSPTRSTFFNGLYPFRSGVRNAVVSMDLANSQVSPYTLTTPKLLREEAGYVSALIGKMHLGGSDLNPDNHPLGDNAMRELGWDYFAGYLDGAPYPIDTTGGGIAPEGAYQCGFVPTTQADANLGADFGVCYLPDGNHQVMNDTDVFPTPGRTCVERGGLFDPNELAPDPGRRALLNFNKQNGFYTGEWKINYPDGNNETILVTDPRARGYRTTMETQYAIDWIQDTQTSQPGTPWMLTLGYSALHAPLQPPPAALLPYPDATLSLTGCGTPVANQMAELGLPASGNLADFAQQRIVAQHMLEAVDHEIGRLLVEAGIAVELPNGKLRYNPYSNTVVVFASDNGTYMPSVKLPFDFTRAKGTLYQSGIWVPLIVAGPASVISHPDRDVPHMVNTTDLFSLFRELAGIDESRLPDWLQLDAQPVRPYLSEPNHAAIRQVNFTEQGTNINPVPPPPCVIPAANACVQIFPQQGVCEDQSGDWYGPGSAQPFATCCEVLDHLADPDLQVFPHEQRAMRNENFKLVRVSRLNCATDQVEQSEEFYEINESPNPTELKLDRADADLLAVAGEGALTATERDNLYTLRDELDNLLATAIDCPGDGNGDLLVDQRDLDEWAYWADPAQGGGLSSWYDLNHDGLTNASDRTIIETNQGRNCRL